MLRVPAASSTRNQLLLPCSPTITACELQWLPVVPPPASSHDPNATYMSPSLLHISDSFIAHDAIRAPLQPPYDGSFKVLKRDLKLFIVPINEQEERVSVDRLKPAHLEADNVIPSIQFPSHLSTPRVHFLVGSSIVDNRHE
ncbi:hypothetical protein HPB49_002623 [Dermacentor silvarum]|uniref:Uncharacterized protein n=1 Tax=Dermacentor silvarum TaxID=543639 RepID=A0ACB8D293_DERSI|nr:hypothetical protein HPB49_002623 [Dermacentor silvarum]